MVKDNDPLSTIDDAARGRVGLQTALDVALQEITTLTPAEAIRAGFDLAQLPAFADHVRGLLQAGDHERAARTIYAALSLILRAHARHLLHQASATATHRAAVNRIGATMSALTREHGERARTGKVEDDVLAGLRPQRRSWRPGRRRG